MIGAFDIYFSDSESEYPNPVNRNFIGKLKIDKKLIAVNITPAALKELLPGWTEEEA